jgi:hypothetical protein
LSVTADSDVQTAADRQNYGSLPCLWIPLLQIEDMRLKSAGQGVRAPHGLLQITELFLPRVVETPRSRVSDIRRSHGAQALVRLVRRLQIVALVKPQLGKRSCCHSAR